MYWKWLIVGQLYLLEFVSKLLVGQLYQIKFNWSVEMKSKSVTILSVLIASIGVGVGLKFKIASLAIVGLIALFYVAFVKDY